MESLFIYLILEIGERRERESVLEKHQLVAFHMSQLGTQPATQARAMTGNRTGNLLVCRPALNALSHTSHGRIFDLLVGYFIYFWKICIKILQQKSIESTF